MNQVNRKAHPEVSQNELNLSKTNFSVIRAPFIFGLYGGPPGEFMSTYC